jgi:hypothetical protein
MPENQIPATQPEPGAEPGEFNFAKSEPESPRIKRRSLKTKTAGLIKPAGNTPTAARELEREAPPITSTEKSSTKPQIPEVVAASASGKPSVKAASTTAAPPRTTPSVASAMARELASAHAEAKASSPPAPPPPAVPSTTSVIAPSPAIRSTATPSTSPHGTRPATLYYSSQPRKTEKAESPAPTASPSPMKTIPTASATSASSATTSSSATRPATSASSTTTPSSAARTTNPASASRPTSPVDYRTNVERQSREQKSVGSILSYVVYGFIAIFLLGVILAAYGANVIFERINSQSVTVSELDAHYASATKDLNSKVAAAQDTMTQAQAQIARQQDLIVHQQDEINKLINATNDNSTAIKNERGARAQETSNLRIRLRQVEYKQAQQQQQKP